MPNIPGGNELLKPAEILKRVGVSYNMRIGDLGCGGRGYFTMQAAQMVGDKGVVYAVDVLKSALTSVANLAALAGLHNIRTVWSNLEMPGATKIPAHSLDMVLLVNMLFQSKKHAEILREAERLLSSGGSMLVIDWKPAGSPLGPPPSMRFSPESIRTIAESLHLKETEAFEAGQFHFGLVFQKPGVKETAPADNAGEKLRERLLHEHTASGKNR